MVLSRARDLGFLEIQEPVLANLTSYGVWLVTPEKTGFFLRGGYAVAGPGFDAYLNDHTLVRVSPQDFVGKILYSTPIGIPTAKPKVAIEEAKVVQPEVIQLPIAGAEDSGESVLNDVLTALDGSTEPVVKTDVLEDVPVVAQPIAPVVDLNIKYSGPNIKVPEVQFIQNMSKKEIEFLLGRLGLRTDGGRNSMINRLAPLSGKTLEVKR